MQKDINNRWNALPDVLRWEVFSIDNDSLLEAAAEHYSLNDNQYNTLSNLVLYVLLGFLQPKEIIKELQSALSLSPQQALDIFRVLDGKIFSRIANELRSFSLSFRTQQDVEDVEEPQTQETVSLKQKPQEVREKEEYTPASFSQVQMPSQQEKPQKEEIVAPEKNEGQAVPDGPFMIHSSDEITPSQSIQKPRIRRSLGGVSGVFGSSASSKEKTTPSSQVQVQIPHNEEEVKTVHYSDYEPS